MQAPTQREEGSMPRQPGGWGACLPEGLSRGETGHAQPGLCSQQFWASPCQRPSSGLSVRLTTQEQRLASPMAVRVPTLRPSAPLETEAAAPAPWVPGLWAQHTPSCLTCVRSLA